MKNCIRSSYVYLKDKEGFILGGVFIMLVFIRIWLITGIPKIFLAAPHDDLFFAKAAHYIIHRQWMGPYSQMTLVKAPFYAFFMIFSFFTGLPLLVNETVFYIIACTVLFLALAPLIKSYWWRLLLFILLLFCPASLVTPWTLRVYRQFVYFSLTLFIIAFSIGLFLRIDRKISSVIFWATGLGISTGAFMLCREEGVWIYPILLLLLAGGVVKVWIRNMRDKWFRSMTILSPIIIWYIPIFVVSYLNYSYYGFWGVSEQLDKNFNRVINTLGRIKTSVWYPYSPVTREGLAKAYEVSPLLAELKPSMEAQWDIWQFWSDATMESKTSWYREKYYVKGAELGAHFPFLFRDALASNGYYSSGRYPQEQLDKMANQLEAACNDGRLECYPNTNIPFVISIRAEHIPLIFHYFLEDIYRQLLLDVNPNETTLLEFKNWPAYQEEFNYFDEFAYNQIHPQRLGGMQEFVGGKTDIRLKILQYKEKIMIGIQSAYKALTMPSFIALCFGWLALLIIDLVRRQRNYSFQAFHVFLFLLGLLISREMTLAIISATTTTSMVGYGESNYLFIYIALFITTFYLFDHITQLIPSYRKSTLEADPQTQKA
jgi:hypothetical protein